MLLYFSIRPILTTNPLKPKYSPSTSYFNVGLNACSYYEQSCCSSIFMRATTMLRQLIELKMLLSESSLRVLTALRIYSDDTNTSESFCSSDRYYASLQRLDCKISSRAQNTYKVLVNVNSLCTFQISKEGNCSHIVFVISYHFSKQVRNRWEVRNLCQSGQNFGILMKILKEGIKPLPKQDLKGLSNIIQAILFQIIALNIVQNFIQIFIFIYFHMLLLAGIILSLYFLCNFAIVIAIVIFFMSEDKQIGEGLIVSGEYISSNVGNIFHLLIIALVHGAFQSKTDESIGKGFVLSAIINEYFDLLFDLIMNIFDGEDFLEAKIIPLEDLGQIEMLEFFKCIFLFLNH